MDSDELCARALYDVDSRPDEGPSALNSTILDYYKKFGRKRDLEQYFSLSTAQGDVKDPSSSFWRRMKSQSDSESGDKSRESSTEICRISIKCVVSDPEPGSSQDENSQAKEEKSNTPSPPIITELEDEQPLDTSRHSDNESVKSDDNQSQKSIDITLDTSLNKPPSPTSSITSQRRLEWDSLADVGYANENDRKNSASSLSTLERLALQQQYSNNDTKQGSEIGLPTAQSTPMDPNDSKTKKPTKTTKIYRREVDHVELNIPESSNMNAGQAINFNLTKHISFNMERDGGITVENVRKDIHVKPEKVSVETEVVPQVDDKEIQTTLVKEKDKSSSSGEVQKLPQMFGGGVPVLINLNAFRRRRKRVTTVRKKPRIKKRVEANKENVPVQEKSGEPVSEAESFEYMPGHMYNQNQMNRNEMRPNQSAGNKSSLESSGAVTTDSSKDSKKSFTKDLEKSLNVLKGALQTRYNDSSLKERLIKEVVQRLLKANYRDEESTTEFLSGLSFSSKKLGLSTEDPTTSTSDANNTTEEANKLRPKKSILRSGKFNLGAVASTSQSAPNLPSMSNNEPVISKLPKTLLTSHTESDGSKHSSDAYVKTSSEELYQKYLEALQKEEAYKKHLRDKEMFLKQKRVSSDAAFNFPTRLDSKSQNKIKNLMKDLTRNNYDDGSGDASKLEVGQSSGSNVRYPVGYKQRSHSVFTLSSGNTDSRRNAHAKKGEAKESPRKNTSPRAGSSRMESVPHSFRSLQPQNLKCCDSSTQVNIKPEKSKYQDPPDKVGQKKIENTINPKCFPQFVLDPNGEIRYVCVCNNILGEDVPEDVKIYKCSRLDTKCVNSPNVPSCRKVETIVQTSIPESCVHTSHTKLTSMSGKDCGVFSKCSQTNLDDKGDSSNGYPHNNLYWVHEGVRCIQTEISIDPRIPEPCLSDIKMVNDTDCAQLIYEQYRQKSKSSITTDTCKMASSENSNALITASSTCDKFAGYDEFSRSSAKANNEGYNPKIMTSVGTNANDLMKIPVKLASQGIVTDPINKINNNTRSMFEECTKGNQYENTTPRLVGKDYVVNTLFTRESARPIDIGIFKPPLVRSNTDSNVLKHVSRSDIINKILGLPKVSTETMTDEEQNQYQYCLFNTYPKDVNKTIKSQNTRAEERGSGKFELHYSDSCDRATYHGVIKMKETSKKCTRCEDFTCQGFCSKDAASVSSPRKETEKLKKTCTDSDPNRMQKSKCKETADVCCRKNQNPVSYSNATCGTSDETSNTGKSKLNRQDTASSDEKAQYKKPKGNLRFACDEGDYKQEPASPRKTNLQVGPCFAKPNTLVKKCVCPDTAGCKGDCGKNAECMKKAVTLPKDPEKRTTSYKSTLDKEISPASSVSKKPECLCPETAECRGLCDENAPCVKNVTVPRVSKKPECPCPETAKCRGLCDETAPCVKSATVPKISKKTECPCPETVKCRGLCDENAPCVQKATVPEEASLSRRKLSPVSRATSPIGNVENPVNREHRVVSRETSPIRRQQSPSRREPSPVNREPSPIRREPTGCKVTPGSSPERRQNSPLRKGTGSKSPSPSRKEPLKNKETTSNNSQTDKNSGSSCGSEGMFKRRCVCPLTAKCGGYCTKNAKCMKARPKPEIRKTAFLSKETAKPKLTGKGDHVDTDSGKSDGCVQTTDSDKKTCGCSAPGCTGTNCENDPPCSAKIDTTESKADSDLEERKQQRVQTTSRSHSEDSASASSSKDLIKEMIQDLTRRYSKKSIHKTEKKKCFKEIMTLLNYLLDTEEESTDVDIARLIESDAQNEATSKSERSIKSKTYNEKYEKTKNITESSKSTSKTVNYSGSSSPDSRRTPSPHMSDTELKDLKRSGPEMSQSPNRSQSRSPRRNNLRNSAHNSSPTRSRYRNSESEHKGSKEDNRPSCHKKDADEEPGRNKLRQDENKNERDNKNKRFRNESDGEKAGCACRSKCGDENCHCQKTKTVKDIGVQLDTRKHYREWCTESSDFPFSTDFPSSDSATCKVLNKIKKECEKYQQRRCRSHHPKRCEISSSTSISCEQCKRACHYHWKQHRCQTCKKEKKKNIGYNLVIQTSDSMISEEPSYPNACRPLMKNIILKVPRNKKALGEKVPFKEITCGIQTMHSPRGDGKVRSKSVPNDATVRDYLEQNRPDFIQQCLTRQKCLKMISESRANNRQAVRDLLSMQLPMDAQSTLKAMSESDLQRLARHLGVDPKHKSVPPKFTSEREMKKHSEKIYKTLPEVQRKKEEMKKERIKKTNLILANIFKKNLQKKTLRGNVNISNYTTVVKI